MKSPSRNVRPLIRTILFIASIGFSAAIGNAQGMNDIPWMSDVAKAKRLAQQEDKLVLLHFGASWCRPCQTLETYVFKSSAVKKAISENVVPVKLDADVALDLVNEYDVSMVPFDIVITPAGRVVTERRSPSDADNYAKMVSSVSSASRKLKAEKNGPIAHQREIIKNQLVAQDPLDFRAKGPQVKEFGLSKDSSVLKRRQDASLVGDSKSVRKSNPWVNGAGSSSNEFVGPQNPSTTEDAVSVADLQRNQFLNREREWVAPSQQTRRAKPERIVNERYFQSLAKSAPAATAPAATIPPQAEVVELVTSTAAEINSGVGEFNIDFQRDKVIDVSVDSPDMLDLDPATPEIVTETFCLNGKCPVTLLTEGRWADGDPEFGIVHRNRTYIFATAEKLALFQTNPDNYSPILAGYDPVVYHEQGKLIEGLVENGVFMGKTPTQKVVLFSNDETREKFQSQPKMYLETIRIATMNSRTRNLR